MSANHKNSALVIGAGPAGLMAAELLSQVANVIICDAMATAGRKFLMAGVGGMNITHSEPLPAFISRYREAAPWLHDILMQFGPEQLRAWIHGLGIDTFIGSSGRVFPRDMKAAPLLRAWLQRLRNQKVQFAMRHRWLRSDGKQHYFATPEGERVIDADVVVFALGGGSWKKLGSDGLWVTPFTQHGIQVNALQPSNCGFEIKWSDHLRTKFSGSPVKPVAICVNQENADSVSRQGEFVISDYGVEGSVIYAASADIRRQLNQFGKAELVLDLLPQMSLIDVQQVLQKPRGKKSLSTYLQNVLNLNAVKIALLYEVLSKAQLSDITTLAKQLKALHLTITSHRPIDEAISTAGGISLDEVDDGLMLKKWPSAFCAGEMLDWEAPTGGYLLTACFATGFRAGLGAVDYLKKLKT